MSNYSDFFGVGSSGGGGGIPVNSYTPFFTSGTGNPSGYDATTGLYTHPDGTFWLETGNQLSGVSSTYPNATQAAGAILTQTAESIPPSNQGTGYLRRKRAWNATFFYEALLFQSPATNRSKVARYNPTFPTAFVNAFNSPAATFGAGGSRGIAVSPDNTYGYSFWTADSTTIYNFLGGANITGSPSGATVIGVDNSGNVYTGAGNIHDQTSTITGTFTIPGSGVALSIAVANDGFLYIFDNSYSLYKAPITNLSGGFVLAVDLSSAILTNNYGTINQSNPTEIILTQVGGNNSNSSIAGNLVTFSGTAVGDATARTDTDSAQPLFLRIG